MSQTDADFYKAVGFLRGSGLSETRAYCRAEQAMEAAMTTFNVTILRRSAMTISFQADSFTEAITKSAETIAGWRHEYDPIRRVFISEIDKAIELLEYRPEEITELAGTRR
jgi:hypothetical protein